ncbi:MAG: terminase large subunit [Candidatus Velthaea sp.]
MTNSQDLLASLANLPPLAQMEAEQRKRARRKIDNYFPDAGAFRRELYPKHVAFFDAGARYPERLLMAANQVGKSEAGAYEVTCHLTGIYPHWWTGRRFSKPIDAWAAGINNLTTRDVIQQKLLGDPGNHGTGMIPGDLIEHISNKQGLFGAADTIHVKHASGGRSSLGLKSYEQGREAWQGGVKKLIWFDEEPPLDVYIEGLYRTATTDGIVLTTFTPLLGLSDVVKSFLEPEDEAALEVKNVTTATWDDVPHLSKARKAQLIASTPPWQRDARTNGIPQLGVGAIYPIAESDIVVADFEIPKHWPRAFGMDVGWKKTAAIHFALNRDSGTIYLYREYYRGQAEPVVHAAGIQAPGAWIPGVIDPACMGSGQIDGRNLMEMYAELGLDLEPAINAVESGIYEVWEMLSNGKLKVFASCKNWISEFRKYHRDEKGKIVKADDHLLDATRYGIVSGRQRMKAPPVKPKTQERSMTSQDIAGAWMG